MISYYSDIITAVVQALFDQHFGGKTTETPVVLTLETGNYELIHDLFIKNGTAGLFSKAAECGLLRIEGDAATLKQFRTDLLYFSNFARFRELRTNGVRAQLEQVLQQEKLPFVILKGLAIKESDLYPEAWLRMTSDIDLLVKKTQVFDVARALLANGFQLSLNKMFNVLDYTWQRNAEGFVFSKDQVSIEVHHSLHENMYLKWEDSQIWNPGLQTVQQNKGSKYVFSREMLLIHLFTHYYKHILGVYLSDEAPGHKFIWVVDLYAIIRNETGPVNWQKMKTYATQIFDCYPICLFVLALTLSFFPSLRAHISDEVLRDTEDESRRNKSDFGISEKDYGQLIRPNASASEAIGRKMKLHSLQRWSRGQRALYKYTILFPPRKTLQVQYNYWGGLKLPLLYADHITTMLKQRLAKPLRKLNRTPTDNFDW